jgi:glutaminase
MSTIDKRARKAKPARKAVAVPAALEPAPEAAGDGREASDAREARLFRAVDLDSDGKVILRDFEGLLAEIGLRRDDARLSQSLAAADAIVENLAGAEKDALEGLSKEAFCRAVRHNLLLIERALQGRLVIPDFSGFCSEVTAIFEEARHVDDGAPASYIPQLNLPEPEADSFGIALCTIDGQCFARGLADRFFSLQSTCKPVNYCMALEEHGSDRVHRYIGREPSGASFNELALSKDGRPHNPMINAGAIMSSSLIGLSRKRQGAEATVDRFDGRAWAGERFESVMELWRALCGGVRPRFSMPIFLSERETADRNYALAYFMREKGAFPEGTDLEDVLELYFQSCSIEVTAEMMAVVAATFAAGGVCPVTGERVFSTETVRNCLSLMSTCGMYDFSGEFAFKVGLPAKSGVSGAFMVVVPNVMGFCTWSPKLDAIGNSVRGIRFCERLVERFNFHNFDDLTGLSSKRDPRLDPIQVKAKRVNEMILAASKGDLGAIQDQLQRGADLCCRDYDLRTPLHLAAAENQVQVVRFFIERDQASLSGLDLSPIDRWGGTPLNDAERHGHAEVVELLKAAGVRRGRAHRPAARACVPLAPASGAASIKTAETIWAASTGNLQAIRRLVAQGVPLDAADYDGRTALHLAASEGHVEVAAFLLSQRSLAGARDRWGNTPLDDARRHGRAEVAALLERCAAGQIG